jgi:hypothetical protein
VFHIFLLEVGAESNMSNQGLLTFVGGQEDGHLQLETSKFRGFVAGLQLT